MKDGELKAIVHAIYAAGGAGDWDRAEKYLSDDLVIEEPASLPYPGKFVGRRALRELYGIVMAHWLDPKVEFHAMTAGDDYVVSLLTFHVTSRRTRKRLAMPMAEMFHITDGKVDLIQPYHFDTAALADLETPGA